MIPVRQSTAFEVAIGPVLDASGVAVTDCVVGDFKLKKTTGNFAALNGSATLTHVSAGTYDLILTTSDVDTVGLATVAIDDTVNGCAPLYLQVVEEAVYDALFAASAAGYQVPIWAAANSTVNLSATTIKTATDVETDTADIQSRLPAALGANGNIKADVRDLLGTAWLVPGTAGTPDVNVKLISADSGAADNLEAAFDGTGYRAKLYPYEKNCLTFPVSVVNSTTSFDLDVPGGLLAIPDYTDWQVIIRDVSNNPPSVAHVARVTATSENTPGNPTIAISAAATSFTVAVNDIVELYPPELEVLTRLPNATPAGNGGLPTVNASNYVAGVQGTINTLDALDTAQDTQHSTTQSTLSTIASYVDTEVAAIKAKTDNLPSDPADQSILAGLIATAQADLDIITGSDGATMATSQPNSTPLATALDDYGLDDTKTTVSRLDRASKAVVNGTVGSGSTTTSIVTSALSPSASAADQFKGRILLFASDTTTTNLRGQATDITANTSGGVLTVTALTNAPVSGDTFAIQ